jgi:hypothetical protein
VFPVRYELIVYANLLRNSDFKGFMFRNSDDPFLLSYPCLFFQRIRLDGSEKSHIGP